MSDPKPVRITRSRAKGSRLTSPNGLPVVCVTRGTRWGNPFKVGEVYEDAHEDTFRVESKQEAVYLFREYARYMMKRDRNFFSPLRGKNLACWCKPGEACHADTLLEIANAEAPNA